MKIAQPCFKTTRKIETPNQNPLLELEFMLKQLQKCQTEREVATVNSKLFACLQANDEVQEMASRNNVNLSNSLDWRTIEKLISQEKVNAYDAGKYKRAKRMSKLLKAVRKMTSSKPGKQKNLLLKILKLTRVESQAGNEGISDVLKRFTSEKSGCRQIFSKACCYKTLGTTFLLATGAILFYYFATPALEEAGGTDTPWYNCCAGTEDGGEEVYDPCKGGSELACWTFEPEVLEELENIPEDWSVGKNAIQSYMMEHNEGLSGWEAFTVEQKVEFVRLMAEISDPQYSSDSDEMIAALAKVKQFGKNK